MAANEGDIIYIIWVVMSPVNCTTNREAISKNEYFFSSSGCLGTEAAFHHDLIAAAFIPVLYCCQMLKRKKNQAHMKGSSTA